MLLAGLVVNEARAEQPIMPLRLFASRRRSGAYLVRMLYLGAMIGFFFFTTQYLQGVLGFTPLQAGLAFLPMSAVNFAVALLVTAVVRRLGSTPGPGRRRRRHPGRHGVAEPGRPPTAATSTAVALPMVLIGIGQGLAFAPMTSAGLAGADGRDAGAASGLVNTFHQLGSALGLGILVAVGVARPRPAPPRPPLWLSASSAALMGATVMLAVALVLVVTLIAAQRPSIGSWRPDARGIAEPPAAGAVVGARA